MAKKNAAQALVKKAKVATTPVTIDDYLKSRPEGQRAALQRVREIIRAAVPHAEECISYGMPAFRSDGKAFVWFAAAARHCALYGLHETEPGQLSAYDTSGRGTIRFRLEQPMPATLIKKLIRARLAKPKR